MTYVDLNPVRAGMTTRLTRLEDSDHTSIKARLDGVQDDAIRKPLAPILGKPLVALLPVTLGDYLTLVEWTGQQVRPGKRGRLAETPSVLDRFEGKPERWPVRVKAIGSGYWRVVGNVDDLIERARQLKQRWLKGIGLAAALAKAD